VTKRYVSIITEACFAPILPKEEPEDIEETCCRDDVAVICCTTFSRTLSEGCETDQCFTRKRCELNVEQTAEVKKLRDEGAELHKTGKHGESLKVLHKTMDIIGVEHP